MPHECNQKDKISKMDRELGEVVTALRFIQIDMGDMKDDSKHIRHSLEKIDGKLIERDSSISGAVWVIGKIAAVILLSMAIIGFTASNFSLKQAPSKTVLKGK